MKRSYGVLAILLPLPNPKKPLVLPYPIQEGDRLQTGMLHQLLTAAPATLPLSTLQSKKLILNHFHLRTGTHIAVFPTLEQVLSLPGGRVHPLLLLNKAPHRLDVFLGSPTSSIDLKLPVLVDAKRLKTLSALAHTPHLLCIDPKGAVQHITEGFYIDRENIRKASGLRKPRSICLV